MLDRAICLCICHYFDHVMLDKAVFDHAAFDHMVLVF